MNQSFLMNLLKLALLLLFAQAAFASHYNAHRDSSDNENSYDKAITTKVKTALMGNKDISSISIEAHTEDGVVTLTGTVGSRFESYTAAKIARNIEGVKEVINNLNVKYYANEKVNDQPEENVNKPRKRYYRTYNNNRGYYYRTNNGNYYYRPYY